MNEKLVAYLIGKRLQNLRRKLSCLDSSNSEKIFRKINRKILDKILRYKLYKTLKHSITNSPFYRKSLSTFSKEINLKNCLNLIEKLSFTYPSDISRMPELFLAVPLSEIVAYHFTAGTTGKRKILYVTRQDLDLIYYNYSLGFYWSGVVRSDVAQVMFSFDIWQLGLLFEEAFRRMGVKTIPSGNFISFLEQKNFIEDYNVSVLAGTPSYMYQLAREIDLSTQAKERIKNIFLGGEGVSKMRRRYIQDKLGGEIFLGYGLMEFGGGVASECRQHNGFHISSNVIPEIVDVKTGERVCEEEYGELVLTSLDREGTPLIRYRTGDVTRFLEGDCDCGLPLWRIDYIKGRLDDRVTVGTAEKYYPAVFEELLESVEGVINFQIEVTKLNGKDNLRILVKSVNDTSEIKKRILEKMYSISTLRNDIEKTKTINPLQIVFVDNLEDYPKRKIILDKRRLD
ncbi:MAG: AMP-binding protein [Candidatus Odinarchaeum yellowstonii]|uniref:AMP-binding protein n=1 Tax=Odinarchaeota yellowstonii (strain LCB_4) TaxID=1841599 RepID=A0AAF0D2H1_ODILC|nr:MAG: AMP-binding protein [Candidatus Odinarchaeum yellowstonii]